jgi:hypothetical protein
LVVARVSEQLVQAGMTAMENINVYGRSRWDRTYRPIGVDVAGGHREPWIRR